jgi:hypothetical protein
MEEVFLRAPGELGDAADVIPVRDVDVALPIDVASVRRAEECGGNVTWL